MLLSCICPQDGFWLDVIFQLLELLSYYQYIFPLWTFSENNKGSMSFSFINCVWCCLDSTFLFPSTHRRQHLAALLAGWGHVPECQWNVSGREGSLRQRKAGVSFSSLQGPVLPYWVDWGSDTVQHGTVKACGSHRESGLLSPNHLHFAWVGNITLLFGVNPPEYFKLLLRHNLHTIKWLDIMCTAWWVLISVCVMWPLPQVLFSCWLPSPQMTTFYSFQGTSLILLWLSLF